MPSKIFISFVSDTSLREAQALKGQLQRHFGRRAIILDDYHAEDDGDDGRCRLQRDVDACAAMLAVVGPGWADATNEQGKRRLQDPDDVVRGALARAFARHIPVLPVLVDGAQLPDQSQLPPELQALTIQPALPFRPERAHDDSDRIAARLKQVIAMTRSRGRLPMWAACLGGLTLLAVGLAAGPYAFNTANLPFPFVDLPKPDVHRALKREVAGLNKRLAEVETETQRLQVMRLKLATVERERDQAQASAAKANSALTQAQAGLRKLKAAAERGENGIRQRLTELGRRLEQETAARAEAVSVAKREAQLAEQLLRQLEAARQRVATQEQALARERQARLQAEADGNRAQSDAQARIAEARRKHAMAIQQAESDRQQLGELLRTAKRKIDSERQRADVEAQHKAEAERERLAAVKAAQSKQQIITKLLAQTAQRRVATKPIAAEPTRAAERQRIAELQRIAKLRAEAGRRKAEHEAKLKAKLKAERAARRKAEAQARREAAETERQRVAAEQAHAAERQRAVELEVEEVQQPVEPDAGGAAPQAESPTDTQALRKTAQAPNSAGDGRTTTPANPKAQSTIQPMGESEVHIAHASPTGPPSVRNTLPTSEKPARSASAEATDAAEGAPVPDRAGTPTFGAQPRTSADQPGLKPGDSFRDCPTCPQMVTIPSGSFTMGSTSAQPGHEPDEGPTRRVRIVAALALSRHPITRGQFDEFVNATEAQISGCRIYDHGWVVKPHLTFRNPGFEQADDHPVVCVNWTDASAYAQWLSVRTGKAYRLPSEAEWEYAARAGRDTAFWWGDDIAPSRANYDWSMAFKNGQTQTMPIGTMPVDRFEPNPWGLYQVHGNVSEWVEDCWNRNYRGAPTDGSAWRAGDCRRRLLRGGSWGYAPKDLRAAYREALPLWSRHYNVGFRVARVLKSDQE